MSLSILLSVFTTTISAQADVQRVQVNERRGIDLVVTIPGDSLGVLSVSKIESELTDVLGKTTDLAGIPLETSPEICAGDLLCISQILRTNRRTSSNVPWSPLAIIVSVRPNKSGDSVLTVLLDQAASEEIIRGSISEDEKAVAIVDNCVAARFGPATVDSQDSFRELMQPLLRSFEPALRSAGAWRSLGSLSVTSDEIGAELQLDGRPIAVTDGRPIVVEGLRPGKRAITLHPRGAELRRADLDVLPGATARIDLRAAPYEQQTPLWAEAAVAGVLIAAGVAVIAHGVSSADDYVTTCASLEDSCTLGLTRLIRDREPDSLYTRGSGPLSVPLGYSLTLSGAVTFASRFVLFEDQPFWFRLAAGLAAGAVVYGLSEAANGAVAD